MHTDPALLRPLAPGVRRIYNLAGQVVNAVDLFAATPMLPAGSILRTLLWTAEGDLNTCANMGLLLAYAVKQTPVAADFGGAGMILPDIRTAVLDLDYTPNPMVSARDLMLNLQLPMNTARLIMRMTNLNAAAISFQLRMIIDGPTTGGSDHGSR